MQKQLLWKCLTLFVLGLLLLVPLGRIESTILERSSYRDEAVRQVAANSAGAQTLIGPLLVITVEEEYDAEDVVGEGEQRRVRTVRRKRTHEVVLFPKKLALNGDLNVEKRAYGLHEVAVFDLRSTLTGNFDPPAEADLPSKGPNAVMTWGRARLVMGLADPRGIMAEPRIVLGDHELKPQLGTGLASIKSGFQATLPETVPGMTKPLPFRIELKLAGTESFGMIPLGDQTTASLRSNWANPSFGGGFLPRSRTVDDAGFTAQWSVTSLAADVQRTVLNPVDKTVNGQPASGSVEDLNSFRVKLIDPVDIYHQSVRAAKYGILFVVLTFAAFFMFETVRNLPIHPVQYGLVGLALALFFLLLLSLSEHVSFYLSYAIAAFASVALIVVYLAAVLRGWQRALGFGTGLSLLFGALFGVLLSEQNALLLGSLLLFIVLAALMLATRGVDWYRLKPAAIEQGD